MQHSRIKSKFAAVTAVICAAAILFSSCDLYKPQIKEYPEPHGFYYEQLSENAKTAYKVIYNEVRMHPERIYIGDATSDELDETLRALSFDNPTLMCWYDGENIGRYETDSYGAYFVPAYELSSEDCMSRGSEMMDEAVKIAFSAEGSDAEKLLYYHDALIEKCVYSDTDLKSEQTPHGVLCKGKASCLGYAKAFALVLDTAGFENMIAIGGTDGGTENHAWNIVKLDGKYYHIDLTWDDPEGGEQVCDRAYFLLSDEEISRDHFIGEKCKGYCTNSNYDFSALYPGKIGENVEADMKKAMTAAMKNGSPSVELFFPNEESYKKACKDCDSGENYYILSEAEKEAGVSSHDNVTWSQNDARRVIKIYFN